MCEILGLEVGLGVQVGVGEKGRGEGLLEIFGVGVEVVKKLGVRKEKSKVGVAFGLGVEVGTGVAVGWGV